MAQKCEVCGKELYAGTYQGMWEAEKEADEDMETDRVKTFDSVEELINDLG